MTELEEELLAEECVNKQGTQDPQGNASLWVELSEDEALLLRCLLVEKAYGAGCIALNQDYVSDADALIAKMDKHIEKLNNIKF